MKKFLVVLALLIAPFAVHAQEESLWKMTAFRSDIEVYQDAEIQVVETIGVEYLQGRRGIFRYVPQAGNDTSGKAWKHRISLVGVTRDGQSERVAESTENGNIVWKIGKAETTLTGAHVYIITYRVRRAIGRFEEGDELYWNVTGEQWPVPLPVSTATVVLPEGVANDDIKTRCFTGPYGSTEEGNCNIVVAGAQAGFASKIADAPLTVVVGWPKGIVAATDPAPPVSETAASFLLILMAAIYFLSPVGVAIGAYIYWKRYGDDKPFGPTVVQYEPPTGLGPAETTALLAQNESAANVAPTLVDLAGRGYVRINEVPENLIQKLMPGRDYEIEFLKDDGGLKDYERRLLGAIRVKGTDNKTKISELRGNFHTAVTAFRKEVMDKLEADGMFDHGPRKFKFLVGVGMMMTFGGLLMFPYGLPITISGIILALFGAKMPKWSDKGQAAASHARGYQEFIRKVEKYRAPWMETQGIFEKGLAFAVAFGLGKKWMKAFEGLNVRPPEWYHGANMAAFSFVDFERGLSTLGEGISAAAAPPRSSGSGFSSGGGGGGGGFSGGGGGGGGGGSW